MTGAGQAEVLAFVGFLLLAAYSKKAGSSI